MFYIILLSIRDEETSLLKRTQSTCSRNIFTHYLHIFWFTHRKRTIWFCFCRATIIETYLQIHTRVKSSFFSLTLDPESPAFDAVISIDKSFSRNVWPVPLDNITDDWVPTHPEEWVLDGIPPKSNTAVTLFYGGFYFLLLIIQILLLHWSRMNMGHRWISTVTTDNYIQCTRWYVLYACMYQRYISSTLSQNSEAFASEF